VSNNSRRFGKVVLRHGLLQERHADGLLQQDEELHAREGGLRVVRATVRGSRVRAWPVFRAPRRQNGQRAVGPSVARPVGRLRHVRGRRATKTKSYGQWGRRLRRRQQTAVSVRQQFGVRQSAVHVARAVGLQTVPRTVGRRMGRRRVALLSGRRTVPVSGQRQKRGTGENVVSSFLSNSPPNILR